MAVVNVTRIEAASRRDLVIGLDCDGVLATGKELWERLFAAFPDCIPNAYTSLTSYDWPRITPQTTDLCLSLSADPEFTRRFSPMPHMAWAIRTLHQRGWEIHIITARPAEVRQATLDWLDAQQVGHLVKGVHCSDNKAPLALNLGCHAFVEDNLHTAEALGALGIRSYLMDASYNRTTLTHSIRAAGWRALIADLGHYQHSLHPAPIPAQIGPQTRRPHEGSLNHLADILLPHVAEPQPAA